MNKFFIAVVFILSTISNYSLAGSLKGKIKADDEGLSNVVVYLEPVNKTNFAPPQKPSIMDQKNLNFVPRILPVLKGTRVIFPNSDKIRHSVFSGGKTKKFDFGTYPPGNEKSILCNEPGIISILCYIHHDMSAYIVVLETPYFSLTNDSGEYSINNIPSGSYRLSFWHEDVEIKMENIFIPEQNQVIKDFSVEGF